MRSASYLLIVTTLALMSSWFLTVVESSLHGTNPALPTPTLYMDHFLATRMTAQGVREYTIAAPYLVVLPDDQGTQLQEPDIDIYEQGELVWTIRAAGGWIGPDNDEVHLQQAVTVTRRPQPQQQGLTITTRDVVVYPDKEQLETAAFARIKTADGWMQAVGVTADLREQKLYLHDQVRGVYEPATATVSKTEPLEPPASSVYIALD